MSIKLAGSTSGNIAEVDSDKNVTVNLPLTQPDGTLQGGGNVAAGFTSLLSEVDGGYATGTRTVKALEASNDYRLRVGGDSIVFNESFPGAAINTAIWTSPTTTMTVTVAGGFLNLNAGGSVATSVVARVSSYRYFPVYQSFPTYFDMNVQFAQTPVANNVCEWGMGIASASTAPTDGAFFRINATGEFRCVVNTNGTEIQSSTLDFDTLVGVNITRSFLVSVNTDAVQFWIDDVLVAEIEKGEAAGATTASPNLPVLLRTYNTSSTGSAQVMKVGAVAVSFGDNFTSKPWSHVMCGAGGMGYQGQTGGTMGTTALYTNSLAPGAGAAMTNTTAALGSGLGGQFAALPTLTANTDGILSSYQVPAGTAALPGKSLYITGVKIQGAVTTVLVGNATPVVYAFSLAFGHTALRRRTSGGT